jgi:hypothetical protein
VFPIRTGAQEPGGQGHPKFSEDTTEKCPFSGGKVPFALVKNIVQIAFFTHGCCKATTKIQNQKSGWSIFLSI